MVRFIPRGVPCNICLLKNLLSIIKLLKFLRRFTSGIRLALNFDIILGNATGPSVVPRNNYTTDRLMAFVCVTLWANLVHHINASLNARWKKANINVFSASQFSFFIQVWLVLFFSIFEICVLQRKHEHNENLFLN
jgi:hypothetical protein